MFGRARRLKLIKTIGITIILIVGVLFVGGIVVRLLKPKDDNIEFAYLKNYLVGKGFSCESLKKSGGSCKNRTEDFFELFVRYDKGFEYIYNNEKYVIDLYHVDGSEKFTFSTGEEAFKGYRNLKYNCTYKDSIVGELDKCVLDTDDSIKLDNDAYIGIINNTMYEVRKILASSNYKLKSLIDDYEWKK